MAGPRFSAYTIPGRPEGFSPLSQALKVVLVVGIGVFSLATCSLALDLFAGHALDAVSLFWSLWALVAGLLALMLLRLPR